MHELDFLWFCQTAHDGPFIGTREPPPRRPSLEYVSSIIDTAAEMGFSSLLTAVNYHAEHETWTMAMAALARTRGAGLLVATRPGIHHPAVFAKMAATAQNLFPGRVRLNVVTGSSPAENGMYGDFEDHADRYARTREYLTILRRLWSETPVSHASPRYRFDGAVLEPKPVQPIPLYLGGVSPAAQQIAAELADVYLMWAEPYDQVAQRVDDMRALENSYGRPVRYGLRVHVIVRETSAEAWAAADRLISRVDPEVRRAFAAATRRVDGVGQQRQAALAAGDDLVVEDNLWAGIGLARSGCATAIVGDPDEVTAKLRAYADLGIGTFILSGYPHVEECRTFGELVLPRFRRQERAPVRQTGVLVHSGVAPTA